MQTKVSKTPRLTKLLQDAEQLNPHFTSDVEVTLSILKGNSLTKEILEEAGVHTEDLVKVLSAYVVKA